MKTALRMLKTLPAWFYPLALLLIGVAGTALGAETSGPTYTPLVGLPGITDLKTDSIAKYINALYLLSISIGGLIGVVKISMAGVKYSMSDIVTSKEEAKEDIKGVLLGLGILLIPFIVLNTIYAGLTNLDVLKLQDKIELKPSKANQGGGGNSPAQPTDPGATVKLCPYGGTEEGLEDCPKWCADLNGTFTWFTNSPGNFPQGTCSYKKK